MNPNKGIVFISGASKGIGRACGTLLHKRGYHVIGTSRNPDTIKDTSFPLIEMDVRDEDSVQAAFGKVLKKLRSENANLKGVILNAGYALAGALEDTSIAEAKDLLETNYFGAIRVCKAALPVMREQKLGHVIGISSIAGRVALPFQSQYTAAKFALEGALEALYFELKPFGIHVTLVEPGNFRTSISESRTVVNGASEDSAYTESFQSAFEHQKAAEWNAPAPDAVADRVVKLLTQKHPPLRRSVGSVSERIAPLAQRMLPASIYDPIFMRAIGL